MIVTLTVHPSLDRTILLDAALQSGEVQSAAEAREDAGGKGINVSRVLSAAGIPSPAVLPLAADDPFGALLGAAGVDAVRVPVTGRTRANLAVTDPAGRTTKINLPGARLDESAATALVYAVVEASAGATWVVLAGSLAPGLPDDFYVRVSEAIRERWSQGAPRIAVDTSGAALRAVVAHGRPDLIKPNDDELVDLTGVALPTGVDLAEAVRTVAATLVPSAVGAALVTLGGAGAVLVTADGAWTAQPPPTTVRSTVGAGDSSLAGYLVADAAGAGPDAALASAIRHGSAAAALDGTQPPRPADLSRADIPVRRLSA